MTGRERMLTALRRKEPDRAPFSLGLCEAQRKVFRERTGSDDPAEHWKFDFRGVGPKPSKHRNDYTRCYREVPPGAEIDEWGVMHVPGRDGSHFRHTLSPLAGQRTLEEIREYPLPDLDAPYRTEGMERSVRAIHDRGLAVTGLPGGYSTFDYAWQIRGMEDLMMDMAEDSPRASLLMDRIVGKLTGCVRRIAAAGVDILGWGEDVGTQKGLMMSPAMWRKFIKPRFASMIRAAKEVNPQVLAWYHSDGKIDSIVEDLIEIGVDVLNPVQPECMDPAELKRRYGDRIAFWGTISTQRTMPFGTPDDVRAEVKLRMKTVGQGGGLAIEPTHVIEPEVPWENVVAFVEACREYGWYR